MSYEVVKFERLDKDVRNDWADGPVTTSFRAFIDRERDRVSDAVMTALVSSSDVDQMEMARYGGMVVALNMVLETLERQR